jgi:hypothetical protein
LVAAGFLILLGSAAADPCSSGGGKKCKCDPPLTRVCGPKDDPYKKTCWCEYRAGGGYGTGSYGKAEIHKKNVPQTHPTPSPTLYRPRGFAPPPLRAGAAPRRW